MTIEAQITNAFVGLLTIVVTVAISYLVPRAKAALDAHLSAKTATVANTVIDGLGTISQAVVQDFNQRIVADAKAAGTWTDELGQSVKEDALAAVKSQGAALVSLGRSVGVEVAALIDSLVEQAVAGNHVSAGPPAKR
jgi:hypothetical protein